MNRSGPGDVSRTICPPKREALQYGEKFQLVLSPKTKSPRCGATVDAKVGTGHKGALVRAKIDRKVADILRLT